jgi:HEAT repeat protein
LGNVAEENEKAYEMLTDFLDSDEEILVQPAISSMGILAKKNNDALNELKPLLKDKNNFVCLWSATALGEAASVNEKAFILFRKLEDEKDVYLRRGFSKGLMIIAKSRPKEAFEIIQKTMGDDDKYVRTNAARALGEIAAENKKAFGTIKKLLQHEKGDVRRGAAEALLRAADDMQEDILPLAKEMAKDDDYYLRSVAAFISAKISDAFPRDAFILIDKLVTDKDEYVRRDMALALGQLKYTDAKKIFPYLKKLVKDRESIVRREAVASLKGVADKRTKEVLSLMPALTSDIDESVRENATDVLCEIAKFRPKDAFEHLRILTKDGSPKIRENIAKCLENVFDTEPDLFFSRIKIVQSDGISPEILSLCSKLARDEEIGKVCQLYATLMTRLDETNVEKNLLYALDVLDDIKGLKHSDAVKKILKVFLLGISGRNINDITLVKIDSSSLSTIYDGVPGVDPKVYSVLEEVPEMALRYKQIEGLSDKHIYLGKMLSSIDGALDNIQDEKISEEKILKQVLLSWRGTLSKTVEGLKGRANLKVLLRTKKLLPQDTLTLFLSMENKGESLAEHIIVELLPSPSYKILEKTKRIDMIANGREDAVEFRIKPGKSRSFRVKFNISYDDFEMKGKTIYFADRVRFIDIPSEFKYIPNPYITGGPIKPASKEMFFGREDVFEFVRDNISSKTQKNVLILQGERRTGKTSILYQMQDVLGPDYVCVFLDGQEFGSANLEYLFYRMAKLISSACKKHKIDMNSPQKKAFKEEPWYVFKDVYLEELSKVLGDKHLVILFDEFESLEHAVTNGKMDAAIFDYIRNLMQHEEKLAFIFAGVHRLEEMMQDYWSVMFNIALYWKISFLEEDKARRLITKPVKGYNLMYDDLAIEKIIRATACHPYFIQLICRFLVNRHNAEKRNYITVQDVNEELINVIEKAKPHFNYIWTLSTSHEKFILALFPEILKKMEYATVADIVNEFEERKVKITKTSIIQALKSLTSKDILEQIANGGVQYRFKVEFISMWLEKHHPFNKVLEEIGEDLPQR